MAVTALLAALATAQAPSRAATLRLIAQARAAPEALPGAARVDTLLVIAQIDENSSTAWNQLFDLAVALTRPASSPRAYRAEVAAIKRRAKLRVVRHFVVHYQLAHAHALILRADVNRAPLYALLIPSGLLRPGPGIGPLAPPAQVLSWVREDQASSGAFPFELAIGLISHWSEATIPPPQRQAMLDELFAAMAAAHRPVDLRTLGEDLWATVGWGAKAYYPWLWSDPRIEPLIIDRLRFIASLNANPDAVGEDQWLMSHPCWKPPATAFSSGGTSLTPCPTPSRANGSCAAWPMRSRSTHPQRPRPSGSPAGSISRALWR
ncbi:MAG TPA: hypothetical protein VNF74_06755 [Terriglobales bacterium]|nr:hypothetical protein [Terriglobales bacterium]